MLLPAQTLKTSYRPYPHAKSFPRPRLSSNPPPPSEPLGHEQRSRVFWVLVFVSSLILLLFPIAKLIDLFVVVSQHRRQKGDCLRVTSTIFCPPSLTSSSSSLNAFPTVILHAVSVLDPLHRSFSFCFLHLAETVFCTTLLSRNYKREKCHRPTGSDLLYETTWLLEYCPSLPRLATSSLTLARLLLRPSFVSNRYVHNCTFLQIWPAWP